MLQEDPLAPLAAEDGETLDAPVLVTAVAMDRIVRPSQDEAGKCSYFISLPRAGPLLLAKPK